MSQDVLPELVDLIPKFEGAAYSYEGHTYFHPDNLAAVLRWWMDSDSNDLVRIGFKVYEVLEYDNRGLFKVRQFSCALSKDELMKLSGQAT